MKVHLGCVLAVLLGLAIAAAPAFAEDPVSGFSTEGTGIVSGVVTDDNGDPIAGITVYASLADTELSTQTDSDGRFRLDLGDAPGPKLVFARERVRISGHTLRNAMEDGQEYIDIVEANKPDIPPRPLQATNLVPEYSKIAIAAGVWTRAWLMLEVSEAGYVRRLKLLNPPRYDLDDIAIREAFKLRFRPARNRAGKAIATLVIWTFEWPSMDWLRDERLTPGVVPAMASQVPCRGVSHQLVLRDCSQANLAAANDLEWIDSPLEVPNIPPPPPIEVKLREPQWYDDRLGWFLSGTGVAFLALGAVLLNSSYDRAEDAKTYIDTTAMARRALAAEQGKQNAWMMLALGATSLAIGATKLAITTDGESTTVAVGGEF